MDISVIIVSWNVKGLLRKCLESLYAHTRDVSFEVMVVDNASSDGTVEMLEGNIHRVFPSEAREPLQPIQTYKGSLPLAKLEVETTPYFRLIRNQDNRGFAAANNQGIKETRGKYILLLNPDTELTENSLKKVFDEMESNASIGVLGCKLFNPDGSLQSSVRRFPRLRDILVIFFKLNKLFPWLLDRYLMKDFTQRAPHPNPLPEGEGTAIEVDQVMGAFFCIRRSVIDTIGPLDDKYFIWFEEVDFCRRAKAAGFKVVYWPGTSIIHHGGQSFSQVETLKKQWWFFRSAVRYFLKSLT